MYRLKLASLRWHARTNKPTRQLEALAALISLLSPLLNAVQQQFAAEQAAKTTDTSSTDETSPGKLPDCLPQLRQLLAGGDSDAIDLWEIHQKEFANAFSAQFTHRIDVALQNFEFEAAATLLDELLAN